MTRRKNNKRALTLSLLSLLLCMAMLVGSTFAWFTDNATTSVNKIESGTLKIGLYTDEACTQTAEGKTLSFTTAGENVLWEPGATWTLPTLYIKNEGNLAAKYIVEITGINGDAKLNEVIDWTISTGITTGETEGHLTAGATQEITISGTMQTTAGNDYQGLTIDGIGITVRATQDTVEHDSDNNQYDKDAAYQMPLKDAEDLVELFKEAATNQNEDVVITLEEDFDATGWTSTLPAGYNGVKNITINGNGHTIYNLDSPLLVGTFAGWGSVTIKDLTIADAEISRAYDNALGVGAFLCYSDASGSVVLENCKAVNCKITATGDGQGAAALVGYTSSQNLTIKDCSVIGCTINGKNASALVGFTQSQATISGCTVTDNTMTGSYAAIVSGTVTGGTNTMDITNLTQSGNSASSIYGRKFVTITLDGTEI